MLLGCIADDFTGAGDLANTLAKEGLKTRLYIGAPDESALDCDAGVVALKSRSIPAAEAVTMSLAALAALRSAGCRQFLFKYCSTFDSTPDGNIGPVAEALADALGTRGVVMCPAFPATGRTLYQGHLFVGDRLLSESGMERHPITPMTDPDIRRWLARQCAAPPGHIDHRTVRAGTAAITRALGEHAAEGRTLVVVDAINEDDLRAIGTVVADAPLLTGGSGIALGLAANFRAAGASLGGGGGFVPNRSPAALLAGSCSTATRGQVAIHQRSHPALEIDPERLLAGEPVLDEAAAFLDTHRGHMPLIYSSASPESVLQSQTRHGGGAAADAVERLFASLATIAISQGYHRLVVAGGETSGAVVTALGVRVLDVGPEIDPGVPALSTTRLDGVNVALALKSGNFGGPDFLSKAVSSLEKGLG